MSDNIVTESTMETSCDTKASNDAKTSSAASKSPQKPVFTEKEDRILKIAFLCLKSGAPEIDIEKLTKMGEFHTQKTAQNTWGIIKKKLLALAPPSSSEGEDDEENGATAPSKVPKTSSRTKTGTTPKKRGNNEANGDDDEIADEGSSLTKKRKSPVKIAKKRVATERTTQDTSTTQIKEQNKDGRGKPGQSGDE